MKEKGQLETDEEPRVWTEGFQEGLDPTPTSRLHTPRKLNRRARPPDCSIELSYSHHCSSHTHGIR